ncbi:hypothetical protein J4050_13735 [Winogradskyella sp. DF17]|uniref:Uncharacterized protein n=1 Tax=Winogradskyella pelagia TaxID=2819984 RepID=A0ABS3T4X6_9FLAO|nr:hypothetical protein [Winogradskyella sp. DF17]MBO3117813.1 hypothetical protein [Winogradskyella sp. DF17]
MKSQKPNRYHYILGLVVILLFYSCYLIFFADKKNIDFIPRKLRHVITLGFTIAVYLAGITFLKKIGVVWMKTLWNIVYIFGLLIIALIGLYDWVFLTGQPNVKLSMFARAIQELLMSPILYIAIGLLYKSLLKPPKV